MRGHPLPPQPPVNLPPTSRHGTHRAHGHYGCRCGLCQDWRRQRDRERPPRGKNRPKNPERGWYVCANRWGAVFAEHEYNRAGKCIRCGADRVTEDYWEQRWKDTS